MFEWFLNVTLQFIADSGFRSVIGGFKFAFTAKRFTLILFKFWKRKAINMLSNYSKLRNEKKKQR